MGFIFSRLKMRKAALVTGLALIALAMIVSMQNCSEAIDSSDSIAQSNGNGGSYGGGNWRGFSCEGAVKPGNGTIQVNLAKDEFDILKLQVFTSETNSTRDFPVTKVTNLGAQIQYLGTGVLVVVDINANTGLIQLEVDGMPVTYGLTCL